MAAYVSAVNDAIGSADFFRQGDVEFLRDAWLAAEFGRHRQSSLVRVIPERERLPDFEARAPLGSPPEENYLYGSRFLRAFSSWTRLWIVWRLVLVCHQVGHAAVSQT